jgi:molybdopterin converting factor small subunit
MSLTVHLPAVLVPLAGGERTLDAAGATLRAALTDLGGRFPALAPRLLDDRGEPYPFVTFYLNDEDIRFLGGFDAGVSDGDELTIVPAVAGG